MGDIMLVSIIIPVYNVKPYLIEALDSVLCQSYKNLEIIIIDDGSTDGSEEVCNEYALKDKRIRLIHQKNKGLSSARNVGLNIMSGEMVCFLDSDDAYHPDYVREMVSALVRENVDMVFCNYKIQYSTKSLSFKRKSRIRPLLTQGVYDRITALRALAKSQLNISVWNKLTRKELWQGIRFPEGRIYEDGLVTFQIVERCNLIFVLEQPLYVYRMRPGSITDSFLLERLDDFDFAFTKIEYFISKNIPAVFSCEHLRLKRQSRLVRMMYCYFWTIDVDSKTTRENLRKDIIRIGNEVGIDTLRFSQKLLYRIICNYSVLLKVTHPLFKLYRDYVR